MQKEMINIRAAGIWITLMLVSMIGGIGWGSYTQHGSKGCFAFAILFLIGLYITEFGKLLRCGD